MTARVNGTSNGAIPASTLAKLAALPPCEPEDVQLPEVCLLLTEAELSILAAKAAALEEAQGAQVAAEQALAAAQMAARQVPGLRQAAGVAAAQAYSGRKVDKEMVQRATAALAEAEAAASAVPVLEEEAALAKNEAAVALGSLRGNAQAAMRNALMRQAAEYLRLGRELARVTGHLLASTELLNDPALLAGIHAHFVPTLLVPAPPLELVADHRGIVEQYSRPMLCQYEHPALLAHVTASRSWLAGQLQKATGLPPQRLMK